MRWLKRLFFPQRGAVLPVLPRPFNLAGSFWAYLFTFLCIVLAARRQGVLRSAFKSSRFPASGVLPFYELLAILKKNGNIMNDSCPSTANSANSAPIFTAEPGNTLSDIPLPGAGSSVSLIPTAQPTLLFPVLAGYCFSSKPRRRPVSFLMARERLLPALNLF